MDVFCNQTIFYEKPPDSCIDQHMKLTQTSVISIILYSILFLLSSVCNLTMIVFLLREMRISKKRQNLNSYMIHLNIANLIITFITIPLEIGWKSTVYWRVGKFGCKFFQFLRPIGIYLSSFILIGLCIDRYA
jgi:gonadotropin-releasing hormone receptor